MGKFSRIILKKNAEEIFARFSGRTPKEIPGHVPAGIFNGISTVLDISSRSLHWWTSIEGIPVRISRRISGWVR